MIAPEIQDFPYRSNAESLFARLRRLPGAIWFDSGKPRSLQGRYDILTAAPCIEIETTGSETSIRSADTATWRTTGDPFATARQKLDEIGTVPREFSRFPFVGGLAGFFGYDLGRRLIQLPSLASADLTLPDLKLGCYTWALVLSHQSQKAWLIFHPACNTSLRIEIRKCLHDTTQQEAHFQLTGRFQPSIDRSAYCRSVARIQDYIRAGDCYQTNFAQHFSAGFRGDPWQAYRQLRRVLPSPYSAYTEWDDKAILCLSPERFLKVAHNQVEAKPIKGTISRGKTVAEDQQNAIWLMNSAKNRAENLMIVDLLRNDLGKVCEPGSIRVPKLFDLESFANVHHLVSTVTGTLGNGQSPLDLLAQSFPGGSVTGAPKKRAMEVIEETEILRRNLYCGSLGYVSCTGRMDTNIAIRTLLADRGRMHCWGGGGIVADSDANEEYHESLAKIASLMSTLEAFME